MKVVIHAPTAESLRRARIHALNLLRVSPEAAVRIVTNAEGTEAAVTERDAATDRITVVCGSTLDRIGLAAPHDLEVTPAAIELLAKLQRKGWAYVRA